ncbi:iron complex transport system ATP-binding protein [Rhodopseudomonas julia]|uniref:Iron complex transport system ATP-binding protein n=1 Tax=Rhodopseudomonas julia TaxID=200617 RepID=A0ABU0C8Y8_9BRAD|nr:ABC transporter ATP-binding protein [Rhodopseudomonas julia]MDQ0326997.1 iron complex transport system ATP-binding protein [Rhodopseudomonas julia]
MTLAAHALGWSAGRTPIVADVDLKIEPGELFGLVGPNGSGKSTLLLLLSGLRRPSCGRVTVGDVDIQKIKRCEVARRIAIVAQQLDTSDRLSVRETVELGRTPWLGPLTPFGAADEEIVEKALAETGISHLAERRWQTLSGGERQRAHIARALAQKAEILILDEPTNHLDIHHQLSILALVRRLSITVVVALHDLNQAMVCDRLGLMSHGRLEAVGAPKEILTAARIERVFDVCSRSIGDPANGEPILRFVLSEEKKPVGD